MTRSELNELDRLFQQHDRWLCGDDSAAMTKEQRERFESLQNRWLINTTSNISPFIGH